MTEKNSEILIPIEKEKEFELAAEKYIQDYISKLPVGTTLTEGQISKLKEKYIIKRRGQYRYFKTPSGKTAHSISRKKYINKPEIKTKLRNYIKNYMPGYWERNPEKYEALKIRCMENERRRKKERLEAEENETKQNEV